MSERKSIKNWAEDDRPREKMINFGPKALSSAELLAILIGSGNRKKSALDIAREILDDCDNRIDILCGKSCSDLMMYDAIGEAKSVTIVAALELCKRREKQDVVEIHSSEDIFNAMVSRVSDLQHEEAFAIYMNQSNGVIKIGNIGKGGIDQTVIDHRVVIGEALRLNAGAIALVHNHPSGNTMPSKLDDSLTAKFKDACALMNIRFLDHVIIGAGKYYSYRDAKKL